MSPQQALDTMGQVVAAGGPLGVGAALALNVFGLPLPSELILPLAGVAVAQGDIAWPAVYGAAVSGQVLAYVACYWLARWAGIGLIERYGRYFFMSHARVLAIQQKFQRHGTAVLFTGICLPFVHAGLGYSAGLAELPFLRFLGTSIVATLIYTAGLMGAGYVLGDALPRLMAESGPFAGLVIVVLAAAAGLFWYSRHTLARRLDRQVRPGRK